MVGQKPHGELSSEGSQSLRTLAKQKGSRVVHWPALELWLQVAKATISSSSVTRRPSDFPSWPHFQVLAVLSSHGPGCYFGKQALCPSPHNHRAKQFLKVCDGHAELCAITEHRGTSSGKGRTPHPNAGKRQRGVPLQTSGCLHLWHLGCSVMRSVKDLDYSPKREDRGKGYLGEYRDGITEALPSYQLMKQR